jgi:hypothetical protein
VLVRPSQESVWVRVVELRPSWCPKNQSATGLCTSSGFLRCGISKIASRRLFRQLVGELNGQYAVADIHG